MHLIKTFTAAWRCVCRTPPWKQPGSTLCITCHEADSAFYCCSSFSTSRYYRKPKSNSSRCHVLPNATALFSHFNDSLRSLQLLWSACAPPLSLAVTISQPQEMMNNMLVVSVLPFLFCPPPPRPLKKKSCTVSLWNVQLETLHAPFSHFLPKGRRTDSMFSLRFLAALDNQLEVDSTSYCLRFPVFSLRSSCGFL